MPSHILLQMPLPTIKLIPRPVTSRFPRAAPWSPLSRSTMPWSASSQRCCALKLESGVVVWFLICLLCKWWRFGSLIAMCKFSSRILCDKIWQSLLASRYTCCTKCMRHRIATIESFLHPKLISIVVRMTESGYVCNYLNTISLTRSRISRLSNRWETVRLTIPFIQHIQIPNTYKLLVCRIAVAIVPNSSLISELIPTLQYIK